MEKFYKAVIRFLQREWFLFVALGTIALIFLIYELIS